MAVRKGISRTIAVPIIYRRPSIIITPNGAPVTSPDIYVISMSLKLHFPALLHNGGFNFFHFRKMENRFVFEKICPTLSTLHYCLTLEFGQLPTGCL